MAKIGSFGDIVFEVSSKKTLTFSEFERSGSSRWDEHEIINQKPIPEFYGPGSDRISLAILLKAELGINPIKQIEKLRKMRDKGKAAPFVIGGKSISSNYWYIEELTERHRNIDTNGNVLLIEAELNLKEYPVIKKSSTSKKKTNKKSKSSSLSKKKALGKITITVKSVNIRSGPGTKYRILSVAKKGQTLTVYSKKNGWYSLGSGKYITADSKYSTFKKG